MNPHNNRFNRGFLRKLSVLFLLIFFTLYESLCYAQNFYQTLPSKQSPFSSVSAVPSPILQSLILPSELGRLEEKYTPLSSQTTRDRLILYIQNAHTQYESEKNVQELIRYLKKQTGLPLVLLEGGEGRLERLFFKTFPDQELKEKMLDNYLRRGELSGGETASIFSEQDTTEYFGIENGALYRENKRVFLEAIQNQPEMALLLNKRQKDLEQKAAPLFSARVRFYHKIRYALNHKGISFLKYLQALKALLSSKDFKARFPKISDLLNGEENRKLDSIQGGEIFREIQRLEAILNQKLPVNKTEHNLLIQFHELELVRKLTALELSFPEWKRLQASWKTKRASFHFTESFQKLLKPCTTFYEMAVQRNEVIAQNTLRQMEKQKATVAVLITGGFHSKGVTHYFRNHDISYAVISPNIQHLEETDKYLNMMQGKASYHRYLKTTLWDALARDYVEKIEMSLPEWKRKSVFKEWRDRMIQNALLEGRISHAADYTKYVDESLNLSKGKDLFLQKLEILSAAIQHIWQTKDFRPAAVEKMFHQMSMLHQTSLSPEIALIPGPSGSAVSRFFHRSELRHFQESIDNTEAEEGKQRIKEYIKALKDGKDLSKVALSLKSFKMKTQKQQLYFGKVDEGVAKLRIPSLRKGEEVEIEPVLVDSQNASEGAYLKIKYHGKTGEYQFRKEGFYFESLKWLRRKKETPKERGDLLNYIQTFKKGKNLEEAAKALKPFKVKAQKGKVYLGYVKGERDVGIADDSFVAGEEIEIIPGLIDEKDASKGAYLSVRFRDQVKSYMFIKEPGYLNSVKNVQRKQERAEELKLIVNYFKVFMKGRDLKEATLALKAFKMKAINHRGVLYFGGGIWVKIESLKKGEEVEIIPVLIDQEDPAKGALLEIRYQDKIKKYRFQKEGRYLVSLGHLEKQKNIPAEARLIEDYIKALIDGNDLGPAALALKPFTVRARKRGVLYFGSVNAHPIHLESSFYVEGHEAEIKPVLIDDKDPSQGAYLEIRFQGETKKYVIRKNPSYLRSSERLKRKAQRPDESKWIVEYIKALKEGKDLTEAAQKLKAFKIKTVKRGNLYFGSINGIGIMIPLTFLNEGEEIEVTPLLMDQKDASRGAYLKLRLPDKSEADYDFKPEPRYFSKRKQPAEATKQKPLVVEEKEPRDPQEEEGIKRILEYIQALQSDQDLSQPARALKPFKMKAHKAYLSFGYWEGKHVGINIPSLNQGDPVEVIPALVDKEDASKGAYLRIVYGDKPLEYNFTKETFNYFESRRRLKRGEEEAKGMKKIRDYILALKEGKNLDQAIRGLHAFRMTALDNMIYFGSVDDNKAAVIMIPALRREEIVEITPLLIDEKDASKGVYLKIGLPDGREVDYGFKTEPNYFESIEKRKLEEDKNQTVKKILEYIQTLKEGKDLTEVTLALKPFKMKASQGSLYFGRLEDGTYVNIGSPSLKKGEEVEIRPILLNAENPSQGAYLEIQYGTKIKEYQFSKEPHYLELLARLKREAEKENGVRQIMNYILALKEGTGLEAAVKALKRFQMKAWNRKLYFGKVGDAAAEMQIRNIRSGDSIDVLPLQTDDQDASKGAYLKLVLQDGRELEYDFKLEPSYFSKRDGNEEIRKQQVEAVKQKIRDFYANQDSFDRLDITVLYAAEELKEGLHPAAFPMPDGTEMGERAKRPVYPEAKDLKQVEIVREEVTEEGKQRRRLRFRANSRSELRAKDKTSQKGGFSVWEFDVEKSMLEFKESKRYETEQMQTEEFVKLLAERGLLELFLSVRDDMEDLRNLSSLLLKDRDLLLDDLNRLLWGFRKLNLEEVAKLHPFSNKNFNFTETFLKALLEQAALLDQYEEKVLEVLIQIFLRRSYKTFSKDPKGQLKAFEAKIGSVDHPSLRIFRKRIHEEYITAVHFKPSHIKTKLAPHQAIGAYRLKNHDRFALLDGVRTGKTLQVLAALDPKERTLIVSPAGVIDTWLEEEGRHISNKLDLEFISADEDAKDFEDSLQQIKDPQKQPVVILRGNKERKKRLLEAIASRKGVIIHISYETLRGMDEEEIGLLQKALDTVILDEWHYAENYTGGKAKGEALQADAVQKINPKRKWILSATPYRSEPTKLFSLFHYLLKDTPNPPEWAMAGSGYVFNHTFTRSLDGYRMLSAELASLSLRRNANQVWDIYQEGQKSSSPTIPVPAEIRVEEAGGYVLPESLTLQAIHMVRSFRNYIADIYNPSVKPEKRKEQKNLTIPEKINFLKWLQTAPERVGLEGTETPFWPTLDKIVKERMQTGKKIILYAHNTFMIEALEERYKKFGTARIDGKVRGWHKDSSGNISHDASGRKMTEKSYQRHRFQEDDNVRILVMNIEAGIGIDLSRGDTVIYAQPARSFADFHHSKARPLGPSLKNHPRQNVEFIYMTAHYAPGLGPNLTDEKEKLYYAAGTVDQIHWNRLKAQEARFGFIVEGESAFLAQNGGGVEFLKSLPSLVGMSMENQARQLSPRKRKIIEMAGYLGRLQALANVPQKAALYDLIFHAYGARQDLTPLGQGISGIPGFDLEDLIALASLTHIVRRYHRHRFFEMLPEFLQKIYQGKNSLTSLLEADQLRRGDGVPLFVKTAGFVYLEGIPQDKIRKDIFFKLAGAIRDHKRINKGLRYQELISTLGLIRNGPVKWLQQVTASGIPIRDLLEVLNQASLLMEMGGDQVSGIFDSMPSDFKELQKSLNDFKAALLREYFEEHFKILLPETGLRHLNHYQLETIYQMTLALERGLRKPNKDDQALFEREMNRFGEILHHILDGSYQAWRNEQEGERRYGPEIKFLQAKPAFWKIWTQEVRIDAKTKGWEKLANLKIPDLTRDKQLWEKAREVAEIFEKDANVLKEIAGEPVAELFNDYLKDKAVFKKLKSTKKETGKIYNKILKNEKLNAGEEALIENLGISPKQKHSRVLDHLDEKFSQWKSALVWMELSRAVLENKSDTGILEQVKIELRHIKAIAGDSFAGASTLTELHDLLILKSQKPRIYENVEIAITSDPFQILNRGMLDPQLSDCFRLDNVPEFVRALIDDLGSRNKMLITVKVNGRYHARAVAKIMQDESGRPVIFLEKILSRHGEYSFQDEILDILEQTKSLQMAERPAVAVAAKTGLEFKATGGYGEDEYSEAHFSLIKNWHPLKDGTRSEYSWIVTAQLKRQPAPRSELRNEQETIAGAKEGKQMILEYLKALQEGKPLGEIVRKLKPFMMRASTHRLHFGVLNGQYVQLGLSFLKAGDQVKIQPVWIDKQDPSKGAYLIIRNNNKQVEYGFKKESGYFIAIEKLKRKDELRKGSQQVLTYIEDLRFEKDLSKAARQLKPFEMIVRGVGNIYFGLIDEKPAQIRGASLKPGDRIHVQPVLIDEQDASKGAYLEIKFENQIWEYGFKKEPNYFGSLERVKGSQIRKIAEIEAIFNYVRHLKSDQDLGEAAKALKPFRMKARKNGIYFGTLEGEYVEARIHALAKDDWVDIEPVLIDPTDPSQGAYFVVKSANRSWHVGFKKKPTYFYSMEWQKYYEKRKDTGKILHYIRELKQGKNVSKAAQSLKSFKIQVNKGGLIQFGFIDGKAAEMRIYHLRNGGQVTVEPVLVAPTDPSQGAYLRIRHGEHVWEYVFKKTPQYFQPKDRMLLHQEIDKKEIKALFEYMRAVRDGQDLKPAAMALKPFEMEVRKIDSLYLGILDKRSISLFISPLKMGDKVWIKPALIDDQDASKGAYLVIQSGDREWKYGFKKTPGYFQSMKSKKSFSENEAIINYIRALRNGENLGEAAKQLTAFEIKVKRRHLYFGSLDGNHAAIILSAGKEDGIIFIEPVLLDEQDASKGAYLSIRLSDGEVLKYDFKAEPNYFVKRNAQEEARREQTETVKQKIREFYTGKDSFDRLDITSLYTKEELKAGLHPAAFPMPDGSEMGAGAKRSIYNGAGNLKKVEIVKQETEEAGTLKRRIRFEPTRRSELRYLETLSHLFWETVFRPEVVAKDPNPLAYSKSRQTAMLLERIYKRGIQAEIVTHELQTYIKKRWVARNIESLVETEWSGAALKTLEKINTGEWREPVMIDYRLAEKDLEKMSDAKASIEKLLATAGNWVGAHKHLSVRIITPLEWKEILLDFPINRKTPVRRLIQGNQMILFNKDHKFPFDRTPSLTITSYRDGTEGRIFDALHYADQTAIVYSEAGEQKILAEILTAAIAAVALDKETAENLLIWNDPFIRIKNRQALQIMGGVLQLLALQARVGLEILSAA